VAGGVGVAFSPSNSGRAYDCHIATSLPPPLFHVVISGQVTSLEAKGRAYEGSLSNVGWQIPTPFLSPCEEEIFPAQGAWGVNVGRSPFLPSAPFTPNGFDVICREPFFPPLFFPPPFKLFGKSPRFSFVPPLALPLTIAVSPSFWVVCFLGSARDSPVHLNDSESRGAALLRHPCGPL